MKGFLSKLTAGRQKKSRRRLVMNQAPQCIYAIGDVHGCIDQQRRLEQMIVADGQQFPGLKLIVYLGDLVDRGPSSSETIDHCMKALPDHFVRVCLCGNHDQALLDFYNKPTMKSEWFAVGGKEALASYGIDINHVVKMKLRKEEFISLIKQSIPSEHIEFLKAMPVALTFPDVHFVHAGMIPGIKLEDQTDFDLMWARSEFLIDRKVSDRLIVHGHTPASEPMIGPGRIGIDTGAYMGGGLTAVRIYNGDYSFMSVQSR